MTRTRIAHLCRSALEAAGFTVETAASGPEALERLRGNTFALVVTDQLMPGMSGLEEPSATTLGYAAFSVLL